MPYTPSKEMIEHKQLMAARKLSIGSVSREEHAAALLAADKRKKGEPVPKAVIDTLLQRQKGLCAYCDGEMTAKTKRMRYCSDACRKRAHREAKCTCSVCGEIHSSMADLVTVKTVVIYNDGVPKNLDKRMCEECSDIAKSWTVNDERPIQYFLSCLIAKYSLLEPIPVFTEKELLHMNESIVDPVRHRIMVRQLGERKYLKIAASQQLKFITELR